MDGNRALAGTGVDQSSKLSKRRTHLAYERSDMAVVRTEHAAQRTFSAWVRTGIASIVAGLGIAKFIVLFTPQGQFHWIYKAIGVIFILVGGSIFIIAILSYRQIYNRMIKEGRDMLLFNLNHLIVLVSALLVIAVLSLILLFI